MKSTQPRRSRLEVSLHARSRLQLTASVLLTVQLSLLPLAASPATADKPAPAVVPDAVLTTMRTELNRAKTDLRKSDPAPYFLSYTVYDQDQILIAAAYGGILSNSTSRRRTADVTMRVGTPQLDNTHGQSRSSGMTSGTLPLNDDPDAEARVLWELTDRAYKRAAPAYMNVKTNTAVQAEEEDKSPDFSKDAPQVHSDAKLKEPPFDRNAWESEVRRLSGAFRNYGDIYYSTVVLQVSSSNSRTVTSEGTELAMPSATARLVMEAQTRADDGMDLLRVETFQAPTAGGLPPEKELMGKIEKMAMDLNALRAAPVAEPYDGPALLSGRAAAVFFHEVLGHRMEGHRQRDEEEGQTFTKKVGQQVLPTFLSVVDDPTIEELVTPRNLRRFLQHGRHGAVFIFGQFDRVLQRAFVHRAAQAKQHVQLHPHPGRFGSALAGADHFERFQFLPFLLQDDDDVRRRACAERHQGHLHRRRSGIGLAVGVERHGMTRRVCSREFLLSRPLHSCGWHSHFPSAPSKASVPL
jgi:PmbA/TldA metallopeptidase C-terminal domain